MIYSAVNAPVLVRIPPDARRVLDVGCAMCLGRAIKSRRPMVVGVALEEAVSAQGARPGHCTDLGRPTSRTRLFDCIVCSHVLEHVRSLPDYWHVCARIWRPTAL
jgi:2-polyprenyl-3-methyl-5-hydroxy-6-metoxy-1,4-benzoquinol methylase